MTEQQTMKVGRVVQFTAYTGLEEGVTPLLKEGERIMIMKINPGDEPKDTEFEVRPVDDNGAVLTDRDGDMLFMEEFKVLEPVTDDAPATDAKPAKALTKRQIAAAAKKEAKAAEVKAAAEAKVEEDAKKAAAAAKSKAKSKAKPKAAAKSKTPAKAKPAAKTKPAAKVTVAETVDAESQAAEEEAATSKPVAGTDYTHDPAVMKLLRKSNNIVDVARTLTAQHEEIYFKLGGVLAKIHEDNMHVVAGFEDTADGFDAYVNENIGGLGKRKAYYLIKIYRHLRQAGITSAQLKAIGWTKARALAKVPVEDLNDEWLEKARTSTRNDLEAEIKTTYVNAETGGNETIQRKTYRFTLTGDANTLVEQALTHAKEESGEQDPNGAFEHICSTYVTLHADLDGAPTLLPKNGDDLTAYAAEHLGLEIAIMGPVDAEPETE